MKKKNRCIRKLKEIVATNKIYTKEMLFNKLNSKLGKQNEISISTLGNYLSESNIKINPQKKYYCFENESQLIAVKSKLLNDIKSKYKLNISEPMLLATSLFNNNTSLYLIIIYCNSNYEKIIFNKICKHITPSTYQINSKSIFFYFSDEKSVKMAYSILK